MLPDGVIHDLGHRRYEGARLGRPHARRALAREALRGTWGLGRSTRSRIVPFALLGLATLPAVVVVMVTAAFGEQDLPVAFGAYLYAIQLVVALFVGSQAPAVVSRDLRFRLLALQLSRPLTAADWVNAKALGFTAGVTALMAVPVLVLLVGGWLVGEDWLPHLGEAALGLVAAVLYAVALSAVALLVAALVPRRGLSVVAVVSVLVLLQGVQVAVANVLGGDPGADWSRVLSPSALVDGVAAGLLGTETGLPGDPTTGQGLVLAVVLVVLVGGCSGALHRHLQEVSSS